MGVFVFLPLVLPLTALPIARLAERHLHPRRAARLLTAVAVILASCSTLCLGLLVVVGTAQLPGNPLPDGWSDPEVREAVPHDQFFGKAAILALLMVATACVCVVVRHRRFHALAHRTLDSGPDRSEVAVLRDLSPYAYALPGAPGRIVVSTGMLACLDPAEREALLAHERAHLADRHHRLLLAVRLAGCANPLLRPLMSAVTYSTERWADEEAARVTGDRRTAARAVGKAALVSRRASAPPLPAFAAGPVPRRVAALLGPVPPDRRWPPALTPTGVAAYVAAAGTALSALSALDAAIALFLVLEAATPL
ncbi:M56 family metallopeptidase [Streptomyces sp. IB2014 016-6]|uniref:M56 family metallopeptidase n=1 Tax=Streptomyces sp. IB2014 016-6 TaxID=2517818 RepID=UPI0011CA37DC|nr:M56 family metallopeptidase [Streptomyces sp. IB2014 016-6]TXL89785.1 M56 family peptidase [Streptomyces sp. IB2014 016-6]